MSLAQQKKSDDSLENFSQSKYGRGYNGTELKELKAFYSKSLPEIKQNEIIEAEVIGIDGRDVILNVHMKADGVVSIAEFKDLEELHVGDKVEVYVEQQENESGELMLSRRKAKLVKGWKAIQDAFENKSVLQGLVLRRTRGGLILDIDNIEAFLPGSQIDVNPVFDYDVFVGKKIDVGVLKINYTNDNVVVSHRMLVEQDLESQKGLIMSNLKRGQVLEGVVKNMTDYGAFIDLGGIDGLLHITDIAWHKLRHPEDMLALGQKVKVVVTEFNEEKHRISLGMKQLTPHPWDVLPTELKEGDKVKGKVTKITDYGAFLEIQKGVEGLLHVSEMSWSPHVRNPREIVSEGQELDVVILTLDREERKMALGLKQLTQDPWASEDFTTRYAVGTRHKGLIKDLSRSFVFLELEPGVRAFLHVSDISWTQKVSHPSDRFKAGQEIEVVILNMDIENRKIAVGVKQLEEDPWDTFAGMFAIGTVHKGTVIRQTEKGAVIELPYGLEGYAPKKGLVKEDQSEIAIGEIADFQVIEFVRDEHRILLSHAATFSKETIEPTVPAGSGKRSSRSKGSSNITKNIPMAPKSTMGEIEALSSLKEKLEAEQEDKKV